MHFVKLQRLALCLFFVSLCVSVSASHHEEEFVPLFDGKTLGGWIGDSSRWSVKDGAIVGSSLPNGIAGDNTFLVTEKSYSDFTLQFEFKFSGGNSGVQFRSSYVGSPAKYVIRGYQADIGQGYFGALYDEKRRGMLAAADQERVAKFLKKDDWNRYEVVAHGNKVLLKINDLITAEYVETNKAVARSGLIALQLHRGGPMEISYRNIRIKEKKKPRLLYVTKAAGYAHRSRPTSRRIVAQIGRDSAVFDAVVTDDTNLINPTDLEKFDAVMFYTTGGLDRFPLTKENREYLIQWVKDGHAFIGTHSATDTYGDWQPYWDMIGGTFRAHPWNSKDPAITIDIEDPSHPAAVPVPYGWTLQDEIYEFRQYSRGRVHVILSMNPASAAGKGSRLDRDFPIAWCRNFGKGRVFYTSLGHREDVWTNPTYQAHLLGGIGWALGEPGYEGDATPGLPKPSNQFVNLFDGVTLSGWTKNLDVDSAVWEVVDGQVRGVGGKHGHLMSPRTYENFHYKADIWIGEGQNSGMYFRSPIGKDRWPKGLEAQVNGTHGDPVKTGSLYFIKKVFHELAPAEEWFTQEVIAYGPHVVVKVNGKIASRVTLEPGEMPEYNHGSGHFGFQYHDPGCDVRIKNVMVRELPSLGR